MQIHIHGFSPSTCTYFVKMPILPKLLSLSQTIMKDKWMNIGYEDEELKPFIEPTQDITDPMRIGK